MGAGEENQSTLLKKLKCRGFKSPRDAFAFHNESVDLACSLPHSDTRLEAIAKRAG